MSETPTPKIPKGGSGILRRKVAGVPVIYLAAGFVAILVVIAWKMKGSDEEPVDAANPSGSDDELSGPILAGTETLPAVPQGTVVVAPQTPEADEPVYEDNSTWMRKAVAYLISHGYSAGDAQLAMQSYLAGNNLTYEQGKMRDMVVKEFGLPPDDFVAGTTAAAPKPPSQVPAPAPAKPKPTPTTPSKPKPKPTPIPTKPKYRTHIVRSGDTLSGIAAKYRVKGGWQTLYKIPENRKTIGGNPNLIFPGQRILIPN